MGIGRIDAQIPEGRSEQTPRKKAAKPKQPEVAFGRASSRGQNLVELALIVPVIALMLAGLVDFGRGVHSYISIANAAREGARFGTVEPTNIVGIEQRVRNELWGTGIDITSIEVSYPGGSSNPGNPIRVRVNYSFTTILGSIIGWSQIPVRNAVEMVIM